MKKKLAVLLALVLVAVFSVSLAENTDRLSQIKERGYITIATEGDWAPYTYHDESNALVGYDVEIGQAIAEYLGVEARFNEAPWDSILAGVEAGRFDIACNGVSYTPERAEKYNFSTPYLYTPSVLVVKDDNEQIKTVDDLKGKKTANTISSIYAGIAEEYGAEVAGVDTLADTIQQVIQGRVDATINAKVSIEDYLKEHPDSPIKIVQYLDGDINVFPVQKNESTDTLLAAVNEALQAMRDDGRLAELSMKYFDADLTNP
ncbi:MAG: transporter substrate-binding domain-containing protein [Clostridia bacterium]|nr:transporter substrate-binding domain-containing protein [Clostridia bacterium]MBR7175314.1 transporter substrate-binding domain-containing protein [Clostridia bacterium]